MRINIGFGSLERKGNGYFEVCGVPLERSPLNRLMRLVQRGGSLFRCLNMAEYMFLKLVVKLMKGVRSYILARALAPIIKKMLEAIKGFHRPMIEVLGRVRYWMRDRGWEKAEEISRLAQRWGNREARKWAMEEGFARYLTLINMSTWEREANMRLQGMMPSLP